jgi:hypothetical protein
VADRRRDDYALLEPVPPGSEDEAISDPDEAAFLDEEDGD